MTRPSRPWRQTAERAMHEYKQGKLMTAGGRRRVTNPKQAVAIALREAGASKYESPEKNRQNLQRAKRAERAGGRNTRAELFEQAEPQHFWMLADEQGSIHTGSAGLNSKPRRPRRQPARRGLFWNMRTRGLFSTQPDSRNSALDRHVE